MLRISCLLILTALLQGCGNKGALYLPSQGTAQPDSIQQAPRK